MKGCFPSRGDKSLQNCRVTLRPQSSSLVTKQIIITSLFSLTKSSLNTITFTKLIFLKRNLLLVLLKGGHMLVHHIIHTITFTKFFFLNNFLGFVERRSDARPTAESSREFGQVLQQPQCRVRFSILCVSIKKP